MIFTFNNKNKIQLNEEYLDDEKQFYDYRTGETVNDDIFDTTTTGCGFGRDILHDPEYMKKDKNLVGEIVQMSPNEYYEICANDIFTSTPDKLKRQREWDKHTLDKLKQVLVKYKRKFPLTYIDYATKSQEGLHRMYVAGELFGWDHKFPVLIINWFDEERHKQAVINKNRREIYNNIHDAFRKSCWYKYATMDEFKEQFQYELDKAFYLSADDESIEFEMTIKDDEGLIIVKEVDFEFDPSAIMIKDNKDID